MGRLRGLSFFCMSVIWCTKTPAKIVAFLLPADKQAENTWSISTPLKPLTGSGVETVSRQYLNRCSMSIFTP